MRWTDNKLGIAIGSSLLLHIVLLQWQWHLRQQNPTKASTPFHVTLEHMLRAVTPPVPAAIVSPPPPAVVPKHQAIEPPTTSKEPTQRPLRDHTQQVTPPSSDTTIVTTHDELDLPPAPEQSFAEKARASLKDAEKQMDEEKARGPWMVKPKAPLPALAKLPEEAKTAIEKSFEDHLGELVILSVEDHQIGNNRVTVIRTNKGTLCAYEPLLKRQYLGGAAEAMQIGSCGPKT